MMDTRMPEYESVVSFVEFLCDEDRTSYTFEEVEELAFWLKTSNGKLMKVLTSYGLTFEGRALVREIRTFSSNPHDRWYGKGSSATHGGSGWSQIMGFAGQEG